MRTRPYGCSRVAHSNEKAQCFVWGLPLPKAVAKIHPPPTSVLSSCILLMKAMMACPAAIVEATTRHRSQQRLSPRASALARCLPRHVLRRAPHASLFQAHIEEGPWACLPPEAYHVSVCPQYIYELFILSSLLQPYGCTVRVLPFPTRTLAHDRLTALPSLSS
jgi:hypothetical protein